MNRLAWRFIYLFINLRHKKMLFTNLRVLPSKLRLNESLLGVDALGFIY